MRQAKLDLYKPIIDAILEEDKKAPRKQRHTALRIYDRLCAEVPGFNCCYVSVANYVRERRRECGDLKNEFIPLIHQPGTAQVDFGTANFIENGKEYVEAKYVVITFPYSNAGFLQLCYGENLECLLDALVSFFKFIGGVPTEIWFDNASAIVKDIQAGGKRKVVERFDAFTTTFRFKAVFMNPNEGHEKGSVEAKVGYLRRNLLVPIPNFASLEEENKRLLEACSDMLSKRVHHAKGCPISDLFKTDKDSLLPLPEKDFETARWETCTTDKYGFATVDKHEYSVSPELGRIAVHVRLTSTTVSIMNEAMDQKLAEHRRLYGSEKRSIDWVQYMKLIARKPRSLFNTGLISILPDSMKEFLTNCDEAKRRVLLKELAKMTEESGFDKAVKTVDEMITLHRTDTETLELTYRRLFPAAEEKPPLSDEALGIKTVKVPGNKLSEWDALLKR